MLIMGSNILGVAVGMKQRKNGVDYNKNKLGVHKLDQAVSY